MSVSSEPKAPRRRLWLRVLFVLSLALNLLFIGLVVGAMARFGGPGAHRPPPAVGAALYRAMPSEDRKAMRSAMRQHREEGRGERRKADAEAIGAALRADPFDPAALETVVRAQLERRHGWMEATQTEWLGRVSDMSNEERRAYADRLAEVMAAKSRHKGWSKKHPKD